MKILLTVLAFLNGAYMLLDGIFVMLRGKYIGPDKPGPWANLFYKLDVNVFRLGPLFITFGVLWIVWIFALWSGQNWTFLYGIILSIGTLWYLPLGTLFSMVVLVGLLVGRRKLGM